MTIELMITTVNIKPGGQSRLERNCLQIQQTTN